MPAEGMLGGYTISGDRVGTDEHPLVRKHLPIDTTVVTTVLEPGVLLKEVEVKGEEDESDKVIAGRDTTVTEGDTYTVVAGDCLWNIAYKLYGTGTLYTKLAEANKLADPYIIYIGQILTVPAK